jgi:hypothetical protein
MISWETLFSSRFFTHKPGKSVAWIPFCMFLAVGCQFQDNRNLTGGYRLIRMNGCEVQIIESLANSVVVAGSVQTYAVRGQYITGYADTTCIDAKAEPEAQPGYFFVDTRNGQVMQAMTEQEWKDELIKIGWQSPVLTTVRRTKG